MYHNMNRWIITLLALIFVFGMKAQVVEYTKEDSALVVKLLKEAKTERGNESRMLYFGKKFLGVPSTLAILDEDELDKLKERVMQEDQYITVLNLQRMNCLTFIEIVATLALCDKDNQCTFEDFSKNLFKIRFRDGEKPSDISRLHYSTWWAENHEKIGIIEDIAPKSEPWGAFTAVKTVNINYMSSHPDLYKDVKNYEAFMSTIIQYEQETNGKTFRFIPKVNLAWKQSSSLGAIKDGDIVTIISNGRGAGRGLDVRHQGIVCWQNGALHLLHASTLYKKVLISKETFYEYEMKQPGHQGIRVFRFKD